jgi:hypothetical protein
VVRPDPNRPPGPRSVAPPQSPQPGSPTPQQ